MRIVSVREKTIALSSHMRNADIDFGGMTASAIAVITDTVRAGRPLAGLAFDSIGRYAHGALLRERFIPRLLAAAPEEYAEESRGGIDPFKAWSLIMRNEKRGGHGDRAGAVGLIDAALWDLAAKWEEKPLWYLLAERFRNAQNETRLPVYASGGHYHTGDDLAGLKDEIRRYLDLGYTRVKIKVGGTSLDHDRQRIEAALGVLGTGAALAVDCNGTFTRGPAHEMLAALAPYDLAWIEEPADPLDYALYRDLAETWSTPLATGENIFSAADTRNLLRYGGLRPDRDWLQMDVSLSYGLVEYLRMLEIVQAHGWPRQRCLPHAGHLFSLQVAAGLGVGGHEAAPDDTSLIGGFPAGVTVTDGYVWPGDTPGVGIEAKENLYAVFRDLLA